MLLRLIAAVMIAAAGAVAGFSKADGLRKDLEISRETGELLAFSTSRPLYWPSVTSG